MTDILRVILVTTYTLWNVLKALLLDPQGKGCLSGLANTTGQKNASADPHQCACRLAARGGVSTAASSCGTFSQCRLPPSWTVTSDHSCGLWTGTLELSLPLFSMATEMISWVFISVFPVHGAEDI